jgi:hypothetical protein
MLLKSFTEYVLIPHVTNVKILMAVSLEFWTWDDIFFPMRFYVITCIISYLEGIKYICYMYIFSDIVIIYLWFLIRLQSTVKPIQLRVWSDAKARITKCALHHIPNKIWKRYLYDCFSKFLFTNFTCHYHAVWVLHHKLLNEQLYKFQGRY